jgi:hypothetical protein
MAAATAISTVRPPEFFVFFVAERRAAVAPVAGGNVDVGFVNELHGVILKTAAPAKKARMAGLRVCLLIQQVRRE